MYIQFETRWMESQEDSSQDDEEEMEKKKDMLKKHDEELREREKAIVTKGIDEKGINKLLESLTTIATIPISFKSTSKSHL